MSLLDTDCYAALVLVKVVLHLTAAFSRLTNGAGTFGAWKFAVGQMALETFGISDNWRLDFLRPRHYAPGFWVLETIGAREIGNLKPCHIVFSKKSVTRG